MFFNYDKKVNINDFINNEFKIYAHKKKTKKEELKEHVDLSLKYFKKNIESKNLEQIFKKIEDTLLKDASLKSKECFREMIINTVVLHDIGKTNIYFQKNKLDNNLNINGCERFKNSNHSILSSVFYIDYYFEKMKTIEKKDQLLLLDAMIMNSYIISRHHTGLNSWKEFKQKFELDGEGEKLLNEQQVLFLKILKKRITIKPDNILKIIEIVNKNSDDYTKEQIISRYIYERLLLSLLFASDFYSTSEFMDDIIIDKFGGINDVNEFYNSYMEGAVYKSIRKYEKDSYYKKKNLKKTKEINVLRNEMFLDAEKKLEKNIEKNIFYLEAPTGSGKSNVATNLSFKLIQNDKTKNKIFYVYPFNTLVEQNINTLKKVFEKEKNIYRKIAIINSVKPIKESNEINKSEDTNIKHYKKALLNRQFLNYPMILTTHVSMFKYLFGIYKEDVFPLYQFANSIIVLDEIQSYKNLIWGEIATFLSSYAELLNIKIIIMSATLPNLNKLTLFSAATTPLIDNRKKFYEHPIFKDRVKIDYSLLSKDDIDQELYEHIRKNATLKKKIVVEFINKNSAYKFYNKLREDENINTEIELITGDDNVGERDRIIEKVKNLDSIILIATQVIEAGIDIDMDMGYKNISALDSEEQFLGRINRSCEKENSIVYFFKKDEPKSIYKEDIRINKDITLENLEIREVLNKKNFEDYYNIVINRLKNITNGLNDLNIEKFFKNDVKELDFSKVEERLTLINDNSNKISIFLSRKIKIKDKDIDGEEIWNNYKKILQDKALDYSVKRVKLSIIRSEMNNFIYEIRWSYDFPYNDRLGDLYYIEDGSKYLKEGKLDKEKFKSGIGDFI